MKFFVPNIKDHSKVEHVYNAIKSYVEANVGQATDTQRIYKIIYTDSKGEHQVEVGKTDPSTGEIVFAIFESSAYLICTPTRGVTTGLPVLIGKREVLSVEYFDK